MSFATTVSGHVCDADISDRALTIETHLDAVQSDRRVIVHHEVKVTS